MRPPAPPSASGAVLTAPVSLTEGGAYTVRYAAIAIDGHALTGSLSFTFAPPATAAPSSAAPPTAAAPTTAAPAPAPAEPSEAASGSDAQDSGGLPAWVVPVLLAVAVVVAAAVLWARHRARSRS